MDALAVSIAEGMNSPSGKLEDALKVAVCFGSFQAFMPIMGWLAGKQLGNLVSGIDHWVVFGLLSVIGFKMILESRQIQKWRPGASLRSLLVLSVATSIDAFGVGVTFPFVDIPILTASLLIGIVTSALCFLGVYAGRSLGIFLEEAVQIVGGGILIAIGVRVLATHLLL